MNLLPSIRFYLELCFQVIPYQIATRTTGGIREQVKIQKCIKKNPNHMDKVCTSFRKVFPPPAGNIIQKMKVIHRDAKVLGCSGRIGEEINQLLK